MYGLLLDSRQAVRGLQRRPWASSAVVLSLALGFAMQIVVFSGIDAVLWKPLAVDSPERIVTLYGYSAPMRTMTNAAFPQLTAAAETQAFESVAGFFRFPLIWESKRSAEQVNIELVSENYFDLLRPALQAGAYPSAPGEILLGYDFWTSRFGSSRSAIGRTLRLNGEPYVVAGIMGREFRGTLIDWQANPKVWMTMRSRVNLPFLGPAIKQSQLPLFVGVARLRPDVTVERAQQMLDASESHLLPTSGEPRRPLKVLRTVFHPNARENVERTFALAAGLASLLLLLGCLNGSFFLLGKALADRRQSGIEKALGAGETRIRARRFFEAALLCAPALAAGTGLAWWCIDLLERYPPPLGAILFRPAWDWRVWSLTAAYTLLAIAAAGVAPALLAAKSTWTPAQSVYAGASRPVWRFREGLVAAQVAVACAILAGSAFILRTMFSAYAANLGFQADGLVMAQIDLTRTNPDPARRKEIVRGVLARLQGRPEVMSAATTGLMPLQESRRPSWVRDSSGRTLPIWSNAVSAGYFETLRLPLRQGTTFHPDSGAGEAIVNETLARIVDPAGHAVGRQIEVVGENGRTRARLMVVGIAQDAKYHSLWQDSVPYLYTSAESDAGASSVIVRSAAPLQTVWRAVREAVQAVDAQAMLSEPRTAASQRSQLTRQQRYLSILSGIAGGLALLIAAAGLMANLNLLVSQRTREIGIRQALGAGRGVALRNIAARGVVAGSIGIAIGLAAGLRIQSWARPIAPGSPPRDYLSLGLTAAALFAVVLASVAGPALRAARIDPWKALRHTE